MLGPVIRSRLKTPVTAFLYEKSIDLLRRLAIWHDLAVARRAGAAVAAISVVRPSLTGRAVDRIAVFVIYAARLDANHRRTLQALHAAGYNVVLVNNRSFEAPQDLPSEAGVVIENHNAGRDIGAYLRAVRYIQAHGLLNREGRVLLLNDSVLYLPGAQGLFAAMATAPEAWIGINGNSQGRFHVGAWCFQLSAAILDGRAFRLWAEQLALVTNRAYLIGAGEIRLSRRLLEAGLEPRVMFDRLFWLSLCERIKASGSVVANIVPRHLTELYPHVRDKERFLRLTNQTHLFTFPGVAFGVFPFVKKDLYHRRVFTPEHIELLCAEIAAQYGPSLAAECRDTLLARDETGSRRGLRQRLGVA